MHLALPVITVPLMTASAHPRAEQKAANRRRFWGPSKVAL